MNGPRDEPLPMAAAMEWVSRILAISVEMVLPGIVGGWLGKRWGIDWLGLVGIALGVVLGMTHLLVMTKAMNRRNAAGGPPQSGMTKRD